jgi:hypothetical protein
MAGKAAIFEDITHRGINVKRRLGAHDRETPGDEGDRHKSGNEGINDR